MDKKIDNAKFDALYQMSLGHVAGAMSLLIAYMGDRLGLYRVMRDMGPASSEMIAARSQLNERYVREWLSANAAAGYIDWDGKSFSITPEAALIFASEGDPRCLQGFFSSSQVSL